MMMMTRVLWPSRVENVGAKRCICFDSEINIKRLKDFHFEFSYCTCRKTIWNLPVQRRKTEVKILFYLAARNGS